YLLSVTVVPPAGNASPNFLAIQHDASPAVPTSAAINFVNQNIANFVITANFNGGAGNGGFFAYSSGLTHVVIDLIGYTTRSENTYGLDCLTTAANATYVNTGTTTSAIGFNTINVPACPAGYANAGVFGFFND